MSRNARWARRRSERPRRNQHHAAAAIESSRQSTDVVLLDLRYGDDLSGVSRHRHGGHARIAVEHPALRVAQCKQHRIGSGQGRRNADAGIEGDLSVLYVQVRDDCGGGVLEAPVAADDAGATLLR